MRIAIPLKLIFLAVFCPLSAVAASKPNIVIVITHEIELLGEFDRVVFIEGGRIQADGAHAELLETRPDYARTCRRNGLLVP